MDTLAIVPSTQTANQYAGGGTGTGDSEHHWCTLVANRVKTILDMYYIAQSGYTKPKIVVIDGTNVSDTTAKSNALKATYHLEIHTNAGGGHGTEYWYYPGSTKGLAMAKAVYPPVAAASSKPDRGIKTSSGLYALSHTTAAAGILEILFHDNAEEAQEMRLGVEKFAEAIAKGLAVLFHLKVKPPEPQPTPIPAEPTPVPPTPSTPTVTESWVITEQTENRIVLLKVVTEHGA